MAQNISLWGASYSAVPAVDLPKSGGGTATFTDTSDANATAADILTGKTAYVNGVKITGTNSGGGGGGSVTQDENGYIILPPTGGGGGGGGSSYTKIASQDFTANTTSTSATSLGAISLDSQYFTANKIIYVRVRDKAGPRDGYFVGTDNYIFNVSAANGSTTAITNISRFCFSLASGTWSYVTTNYGIYVYSIASNGSLSIYQRYNSTYTQTINGTYNVTVYALDYAPDQGNPFNYSF